MKDLWMSYRGQQNELIRYADADGNMAKDHHAISGYAFILHGSAVRGHSFPQLLHCLLLLLLCYFPLHPPIMTSVLIPKSLIISEQHIDFPFTFSILSPLFFHLLFQHFCQTLQNGLYLQPLCLFLFSSMFISIFIFIFISYVTMSHLYIWGLGFHFTYSHRLPPSRSSSFPLRISC